MSDALKAREAEQLAASKVGSDAVSNALSTLGAGVMSSIPARPTLPTTPAPTPAPADEGRKDDEGKAPWHLLPYDAINEVLRVLAYGAKKYAPRNWEKGMDWDRCYSAAMRHMTDWYMRRDGSGDKDTGISHLAHAICCLLFLLAYELRRIGTDTRPQV